MSKTSWLGTISNAYQDDRDWSAGAPLDGSGTGAVIQSAPYAPMLANATIDGYSLTLDGSGVTFDNVTIGGAAPFQLFAQPNGAFGYSGTLDVSSGVTLEANATLSITDIFAIAGPAAATFENDGTILVSGASAGLTTQGATFVNNGVVDVDHAAAGDFYSTAPVTGTGTIQLRAGSFAQFENSVASSQTIDFENQPASVALIFASPGFNTGLRSASDFAAALTDVVAGDGLFLEGPEPLSIVGYNGSILVLNTSAGVMSIRASGSATGFSIVGGANVIATGDSATIGGGAANAGTATVTGADGSLRSLLLGSAGLAVTAQTLLDGITPALTAFVDTSGVASMGSGQTGAVVDATGAVTLAGGTTANETVAAGAAPFNFLAGAAASGTVIAGGGADNIVLPIGTSNWSVLLGDNVDTVEAFAGADFVRTGPAGGFVFLGAGASSVASNGADTLVGASGVASVSATGDAEVFAFGGPLSFDDTTGASTVVAGETPATLVGGNGTMFAFTDGATTYTGGGGADTLAGLDGGISVTAGSGGGLFFGGAAGGNLITAAGGVTALGGGAGDVLTATGSGNNVFAGGPGAETLTGAASAGTNTFFAGTGNQTLIAGTGHTVFVAGPGNDFLDASNGTALVMFSLGRGGGADTIGGFNPIGDGVALDGFAPDNLVPGILATATTANGSTTIALPDGTKVTFAGVTQLAATSFTGS